MLLNNCEINLLTSAKVTMVVNSCDLYQDVWPLFFSALDEYWPNREFDVIINTEIGPYDSMKSNLSIHQSDNNSGVDDWGLRLIRTLKSIMTEYVILVFDDFILESMVEVKRVNNIISFMDDNENAAVFYLNAVCLKSHVDDETTDYRVLKDRVDYRLNSAPALWRRKDLINYTREGDNPWTWEIFGSYRTFGDVKDFYCTSSVKRNIYNHQYKKGGAIYRGKWVADVVLSKNTKYNLNIDFSKRGFSDNDSFEKRNLLWKVRFIYLGFRTVRFKVIYFITGSLKAKIKNLW